MSANDVGSALQLKAFMSYCLEFHGEQVEFFICANEITGTVMQGASSEVLQVDPEHNRAARQIEAAIDRFRPHYAFVGLSSYDENIDNLVMKAVLERRLPTGVIQDFWGGYTGTFRKDFSPDFFFALDQESKDLCQKKLGDAVECLVSGSPKHERFLDLGHKGNSRFQKKAGKKLTFFAQPRFIPGYEDNLKNFCAALKNIQPAVQVAFRPHPMEADRPENLLERLGFQFPQLLIVSREEKSESYLLDSDLVVTCFSTVGMDHNYLQAFSEKSLGNLLYLLVGNEIVEFLQKETGLDSVPNVKRGMGREVRAAKDMMAELERGLFDQSLQESYHQSAKRHLQFGKSPCRIIWEKISAKQSSE